MKYNIEDIPSFQQQIMGDLHKKVIHEWHDKLKQYIIKNLSDIGFVFASDNDFIDFVKTRVKQYTFLQRPHYHELYVEDKEGRRFIGSYSDEINIKHNVDNTVTATIG